MKAIVTTTINPPSKAILEYAKLKDWVFYIVGDQKTPHNSYESSKDWIYLHPKQQEDRYSKLSAILGWNSIQRRNIGFIQAIKDGAEVVATVDDDNIPLENWGVNLYLGHEKEFINYENEYGLFDPFSVTSINNYWHRGYPPSLVKSRFENNISNFKFTPKIQANLWNGKPDADAISKLLFGYSDLNIEGKFPFSSSKTILSSQNAFFHKDIIQHYAVLPFCGRMDDIWGCIVLQSRTNEKVVFGEATTFHDRNYHNLIVDLKEEIIGYEKTIDLLEKGESELPHKTRLFLEEYNKEITC